MQDRLLSTMGGAADHTYTIHPMHIRVRRPLDIDDDQLNPATGGIDPGPFRQPGAATDSTYYLHRLRLGELSRDVVDLDIAAESLRVNRADLLADVNQIEAELEKQQKQRDLYDRWQDALPASFRVVTSGYGNGGHTYTDPDPAREKKFSTQRRMLHLSFHARRARMLLLQGGPANVAAGRASAMAVLDTASSLLEDSLGPTVTNTPTTASSTPTQPTLPFLSAGILLNHLFVACAVLAASPTTADNNDDATKLARACRLLETTARQNPLAARVLRRLRSALRSYGRRRGVPLKVDVAPTSIPSVAPSLPAAAGAGGGSGFAYWALRAPQQDAGGGFPWHGEQQQSNGIASLLLADQQQYDHANYANHSNNSLSNPSDGSPIDYFNSGHTSSISDGAAGLWDELMGLQLQRQQQQYGVDLGGVSVSGASGAGDHDVADDAVATAFMNGGVGAGEVVSGGGGGGSVLIQPEGGGGGAGGWEALFAELEAL
jgi:hypothetical protein